MTKFFKKLSLFSITFLIIFLIVGRLYVNYILEVIYSKRGLELPFNIITVFFGDSQALTSFHPGVIKNSFNASHDSEYYFYTLYKMNVLLKNNPQIENVVLSYSYHSFSIATEIDLLYCDKYYFIFDENGKNIIHSANNGELLESTYNINNGALQELFVGPLHFFNSNFLMLKYDIGIPIDANNYLSFYARLLRDNKQILEHPLFQDLYESTNSNLAPDVINEAIKTNFYYRGEINSSDLMIESLYKMAELCNEDQIKFILINTPLHPSYSNKIPDYYIELHNDVLVDLKDKFNNIQYFDFSSVNYPDSLFGDGNHLNAWGLERFSKEIEHLFSEQVK